MSVKARVLGEFRLAHRLAEEGPLAVGASNDQDGIRFAIEDSDRADQVMM
jgi:hypothetical protein